MAKNDGSIEIWDLLESNNASVSKIVVCDDPLIGEFLKNPESKLKSRSRAKITRVNIYIGF